MALVSRGFERQEKTGERVTVRGMRDVCLSCKHHGYKYRDDRRGENFGWNYCGHDMTFMTWRMDVSNDCVFWERLS